MESITDTTFDVVIAGTGLAQSLLALALSRENKKILHVDKNSYYGGNETALSLQDAVDWRSASGKNPSPFSDPQITSTEDARSRLGFSRSYSLALAPQIIYSKAALLPTLVSSKVYRQLEFLAVGAWWTYDHDDAGKALLKKIPGSREDIFADKSIDLKSKRALMKFIKFISDIDAYEQALETWGEKSLEEFLTKEYNIPLELQPTIHALTLSPRPASETTTLYALPRILRHLSSIGVFGPGFGAVIPKWGGLAEVTQVACRACAVGGGIYMLGKGLASTGFADGMLEAKLEDGQDVKTGWIAGASYDLPTVESKSSGKITRSLAVVASNLESLFPSIADGAPTAACSIVVFPADRFSLSGKKSSKPIYLNIHNSQTGECPADQCVIYGSIAVADQEGKEWLAQATQALLRTASSPGETIDVLWTFSYSQLESSTTIDDEDAQVVDGNIIKFSDSSTDLAFDDLVLREVRTAWQKITGKVNGFMQFEDREVGEYDEHDG